MTIHSVILIRHAKAVSTAPGTDAKRPLSPAGREQARALGAKLQGQLREVDTVFVSPAVRAQQTWDEIVRGAKLLDSEMPEVRTEERIYSGSPMEIMEMVRLESGGKAAVVVGHEPTISGTAYQMVKYGEAPALASGMPTGSAVTVEASRDWKEWHSHVGTVADYQHVGHK